MRRGSVIDPWYSRCTSRPERPPALRGGVDLGLLEPARIVDVDRLPLSEDVKRGLTGFAVAVARLLRPAEWEMDLGADRPGIHVRDAGVQVAHRAESAVHVAREDRRGEPEADAVRGPHGLVEVPYRNQRRRRAEDLLLCDPHLRLDVAEDRWP